jgi:HSP20 family protein
MSDTAIQKRENKDNVVNIPERIEQAPTFTPLVDIIETGEGFLFQADLPGVKAGDVDISYENGVLTLAGKVEPRYTGQYVWQEYGVGNYYRQFTLNTPINVDGIRAELKNGVLELHVPKAESAKTRKIEIKTS